LHRVLEPDAVMLQVWQNTGGSGTGYQPTLSDVFAGATGINSRYTFTRASSKTYFDANGALQTALTDVPAFDHNPTTLAALGLGIHEERTNLFLNSLANGTSLSTQGVTTTAIAYTVSFYGTCQII